MKTTINHNADGTRSINFQNENNPVENNDLPLSWCGCDEEDSDEVIIREAELQLAENAQ